jgi:pimeloyl-ACP methyl ester carboxylesterase
MAQLLVRSADGTQISSESYGEGRPLVIVSGALFASERWLSAIPWLSAERRPIVIDRRGRGKSGDTAPYAPEREVEDISAVLAAIPGPVDLLGHSSGAVLALQTAATLPANLERLVAYEPPVFFNEADGIAPDLPERLEALLAAGDRGAAVSTFLREGPRVSERDLRGMQAGAFWPLLLASLAHTVPYDSRVQRSFEADAAELARIQIPTLMLVGGASPERMLAGARTIAARIPRAELAELTGQQHMAQLSAAPVFAAAVNEFLARKIGAK